MCVQTFYVKAFIVLQDTTIPHHTKGNHWTCLVQQAVMIGAVQCMLPGYHDIGSTAGQPLHPPVSTASRLWPAAPTLHNNFNVCSSITESHA